MQVVFECNMAEQWLREKTQQQESVPKNADPVLWSSEIKKNADTLDAYVSYNTNLYNKLKLIHYNQMSKSSIMGS